MIQAILIGMLVLVGISSTVLASDVYLEQAGSSATIDITQTGDGNRVGTSTEATTLQGGNADVDILQEGTSNTIDVEQSGSVTSGADINLTQKGASNIIDVNTEGAEDLAVAVTQEGDNNEVNVCGAINTGSLNNGVVTDGQCTADITVGNFEADITTKGDGNNVNVARSGVAGISGTKEVTVNIGSTVASDNNVVNINQTDTSQTGLVNLKVDGNTNLVNITQN